MAANNETGVISDLAGIGAVLDESAGSALWLVDCVQALGKLALELAATRIDYAPFSGHKLYAPKGIGMLYVRAGAPYTPLMTGGGQEAGQRAGTENMAGIAALGAVLAALEEGGTFRTHAQMLGYRARLAEALRAAFPGLVFNAPFEHALPTTLNFSVPGQSSGALLNLFDAAALHVSAGSACSAAQAAPSYVLAAMGLPGWRAASALRMSFGALADDAMIDAACERIARCGHALRSVPAPPPACVAAPAAALDAAALDADRQLDRAAVERLLAQHPEALLVDVREAAEHAACAHPFAARATLKLPLSHLDQQLPGWLRQQTRHPVVFFCRSGNRSARAAQRLHQLGYPEVWHLAGGLALA
jgi:rhodanese-related sulfurtransferase